MRLITPLILITAINTPALAHPGFHADLAAPGSAVQHFLSSPFHLAMIAIVLLALGVLANGIRNRKARQTKNPAETLSRNTGRTH